MVIIGKRADGYVIECDCGDRSQSFVVQTLGSEVHCPSCGRREASLDLTTSFVFMRHACRVGRQEKVRALHVAHPVDVANDFVFMLRNAN